ncbi:MAG: hypothetical protein LBT20_02140 [Clostridiales bacterium]|jgi:hypothetical protein|nr:hypothetical protein [Clostridiales bacterium]
MISIPSFIAKIAQKSESDKEKAKELEKELIKQLKEIEIESGETASQSSPAPALKLDKLEFRTDDDDALKKRAEIEAEKLAADKLSALSEKNVSEVSGLDEQKTALSEKKDSEIAALKAELAEIKKQADNDTLKRGLQRSSIATGRVDEIDKAGIGAETRYISDYNRSAERIDRELLALKNSFESSVKNLEFEKAYEAEKKLAALKKERDDLVAEMIKYNNTVDEKENDYIMKYNKYLETTQGASAAAPVTEGYSERYDLALEFYSGLDKSIAQDLIKNNAYLKSYLGTASYTKLLNALK